MRHGEAETGMGYRKDFDRKLTPHGINKLQRLNTLLESRAIQFDLLIKSPAQRAMETAELLSSHLAHADLITNDKIYEGSVETLLEIIEELPDQYQNVLLVGHNPSLTSLLLYLTNDFNFAMLPGMMAVVTFHLSDWKALSRGTGYLNEVLQ